MHHSFEKQQSNAWPFERSLYRRQQRRRMLLDQARPALRHRQSRTYVLVTAGGGSQDGPYEAEEVERHGSAIPFGQNPTFVAGIAPARPKIASAGPSLPIAARITSSFPLARLPGH